jgi:hypothetical protein
MRSIESLAVNSAGVLCGFFPPGDHVFRADPRDVATLDDAIRTAVRSFRVVQPEPTVDRPEPSSVPEQGRPGTEATPEQDRPGTEATPEQDRLGTEATPGQGLPGTEAVPEQAKGWIGLEPLAGYVRSRIPGFERRLAAERTAVTDEELAMFAEALGVSTPELIARLRPARTGGRWEIPALVRTSLARAVARLRVSYLPEMLAEHIRRSALDVATAGWRPTIDPSVWIPDAAEVASTVDPGYWPDRPPIVAADISDLVLLAVLCTIGSHASSGPGEWHGLGGFGQDEPDVDPGPVPGGAVVVRLSIYDDHVERLGYLMKPDDAYVAVTLREGR